MESRHLVVMMTDIQGFTRATSGMGRDAVESLLALHEDLLVPVIKEHEGTIVKGLGDAFLVTFESPTMAVEAGARIQEVLREHNRKAEEGEQLHVRVALNAGEVNIREDDVFGEAVNITARVEGVCAAEQVTLTEAVYLLLDRDKVETEYLEEVELKGIPFPVKLYRVDPYWLDPDERDIERARSKPSKPGSTGGGEGGPPILPVALAAAAALALGAWFSRPPSPASLVAAGTAEKRWEEAFAALEKGQREAPSPELRDAGVAFWKARLEARRAAGEWLEAYQDLKRFSAVLPGLEGVSRPSELQALGLEGVRALRKASDWAKADSLLEEVMAAGDLSEHRKELAGWAREDLVRAWEAAFPGDRAPPADFERRVGDEQFSVRLRRLEKLDPKAPWLHYVQGIRAMMAGKDMAVSRRRSYGDDVERRMKKLAGAAARNSAFGERRELEPVVRALMRYLAPPGDRDDAWGWAEQWLVHRVGAWIEAPMTSWANEAPPEGADSDERISNQNLRRNSLRILVRRGLQVAALPGVHLKADIALLALRPKDFNHNRQMEEVQDIALRFSALSESGRVQVEKPFRELVSRALEKDDESIGWRRTYTRIACDQGWKDLCLPDRELWRDLSWHLSRLRDWRFKGDKWFKSSVTELLAKVPATKDPWKTRIHDLVKTALPLMKEKFAEMVPELEKTLKK